MGEPNKTTAYTYGDSTWKDLLTGYGSQTLTYDNAGNLTSYAGLTYVWKHGRELEAIVVGSHEVGFTYNSEGLRTRMSLDGETIATYVYDGDRLVQMTSEGHTMYFTYGANGPISVNFDGTTYYYVTNLQGDVIRIIDGNGQVVVNYHYNAWGKVTLIAGPVYNALGQHNPFRYRGYVYDRNTGLYYLQSRYYNPDIGRFISADAFVSTGQGFTGNNMFAYCNNNPVNMMDPCGTIPFADDFFAEDYQKIGEKIARYLISWYEEDKEEAEELTYRSQGKNKGAKIPNSYRVTNIIVMYEYISEHRGDEISGSTTGVVFEWLIHNAGYYVGGAVKWLGFADTGEHLIVSGQHLDVGNTIYNDSHKNGESILMWLLYNIFSPITSRCDLIIRLYD